MAKDDELVLVIPTYKIFEKGVWQGLKIYNLDYYLDLIKKNYCFKRRGDVENDDSWQQIIPYIVFNFQDKYFLYKYLPQAGEQRLVDTYQLGVGGHINPIDGASGKDFLEEGMMREWQEEIDFKGNIISKKIVGILNDDSRPVEKVHLGLVYSFEGDSPEISIRETDKMAGELVDLKDIGSKLKTNDGVWVKIVYREYLSKLIYTQSEFFTKYQEFVKSVTKKYEDPEKEIMTWGLGISGEAGDVAGCIKKTYSHNNDQMHGIRENLGDTLWYIAAICNFYGWNLEDIFNENIDKLKNRYSGGHFTEQDAAKRERIDWNEKK